MDAPQYVHADVTSGSFCYWMSYYTHHSDMDAPHYVHTDVTSDNLCPWMFYDTHHILYHKTCVLYQIPLSTTNAVDYGVLTVHESNATFPVTRHQFRMLCNTDILQLLFEDLNQFMSPHKISDHYISSVTVSCSNRHPVHAGCLLSRHVLLGQLDPWRWDRLVIPKRKRITTLRLPQTGAKYSQRWRWRQYCPSFACLSTPMRQFCGSICDNVFNRRRRGTFISCLRRWRKFQVCISIRPL